MPPGNLAIDLQSLQRGCSQILVERASAARAHDVERAGRRKGRDRRAAVALLLS